MAAAWGCRHIPNKHKFYRRETNHVQHHKQLHFAGGLRYLEMDRKDCYNNCCRNYPQSVRRQIARRPQNLSKEEMISMFIPPLFPAPNIERVALVAIVAISVVGLTFGKSRYDGMIL